MLLSTQPVSTNFVASKILTKDRPTILYYVCPLTEADSNRGNENMGININQKKALGAYHQRFPKCFVLDPFDFNMLCRKIIYQDQKIPQMAIVFQTAFCKIVPSR